MKTDYCKYVNVFQGTGEIDLPEPRGVAARWKLIKGLCGSNTPAAALPFGRINAGCYSGGYSAGYGHLMYNTHGPIKKLYDKDKFKGISHLQNDGTGDIDTFYNYAVISPYAGDLSESAEARDFTDESAQPGYYACRDASTGALCEVTVTRRAALHRITFPKDTGCISIDFSNDGLYEDGGHLHSPAGSARLALIGDDECAVCARLHGIDIYFCVSVKGARGSMRLWRDHAEIDERELTLDAGHTFGVTFSCARIAEITLALSPKSEYVALRDARGNAFSFDKARRAAYDEWNQTLSRLACEFDDPRDYEIFYSNLYHSLLKPCDFSGESFLYEGEDFVSELATIWDQYKTQLPLVYMLYPEMPHRIVNTFLNICEATHKMPHTLMLYGEYAGVSTGQARMLAEFSIADAYLRGVDFDVERALRLMEADTFEYNHFDELAAQPENVRSKAFIIDITDACAACALVARSRGDTRLAERFEKVASLWSGVFDRETGLLQDGERFYEGSKWNYSFRLMHDMEGRAALAGGKEGLAHLADVFFGFTQAESGCDFEGFNNETDMEAPYVYHFADRHDRLSEVIDAGLTYMFTTGRGGVPGNNDSGGLCSLYVWNALGIFPVSGQDLMIIGSPRIKSACFSLSNGKTFTVRRYGSGIYVHDAYLNGRRLGSLCFGAREMMAGGTLELHMGDAPK